MTVLTTQFVQGMQQQKKETFVKRDKKIIADVEKTK